MAFLDEKKRRSPWKASVKLVYRADDLTYEEEGDAKAEMHCGHAFTPKTIKQWCTDEVEKGRPLSCPVCGEKWSYPEVRDAALLSENERKALEQSLVYHVSVVESKNAKQCPVCHTLVEREDKSNLCVHCLLCSAKDGKPFFFCWNCLNKWKGPYPRSDRCDNNCIDPKQLLLLKCEEIALENVPGVVCPSVRACPNCWTLIEHNKKMCKNVTCPNCRREFCFLCLKPTDVCCSHGGWFNVCPDGIAPRQTYKGTNLDTLSSSQDQFRDLSLELEDSVLSQWLTQDDSVAEVIRGEAVSRKKKRCRIQ